LFGGSKAQYAMFDQLTKSYATQEAQIIQLEKAKLDVAGAKAGVVGDSQITELEKKYDKQLTTARAKAKKLRDAWLAMLTDQQRNAGQPNPPESSAEGNSGAGKARLAPQDELGGS
jgi:hypothetical protein